MAATFSEIVDRVHELDSESKQELLTLIRRWLIDDRREEILRSAKQAEAEFSQGEARTGNVDELMADLYSDD